MSLLPSINCISTEHAKLLDAIHEPRDPCLKFRVAGRILGLMNRFFKARNAKETNLIALTQGAYRKNDTAISVYYANQSQAQDVLLPQLCKWRSQLKKWDYLLGKKLNDIELIKDRATIRDSLLVIGNLIMAFSCAFSFVSSPRVQTTVLVAEDFSKNIQAVGYCTIREMDVEIIGLATAPANLLLKRIEKNAFRVSGGGSAIISHLFSSAVLRSWEKINVDSLSEAVSFYQKMGFESSELKDPNAFDCFCLPVKNTLKKVSRLIEKQPALCQLPIKDASNQAPQSKENIPPPFKKRKISET